jgi:glycosyltransferase involved in cell wall biosynthesis
MPLGTKQGQMPQLSLIIPTFNRQQKVVRAVKSILDQSFKGDLELIVVDDGSSPPIKLPGDLALDSRVKVMRRERTLGPAAGRNAGMTESRGDWIGFLDSDDYLLPDTLNRRFAQVLDDQARRSNPLVLYTCGWLEVNQDGTVLRTRYPLSPAGGEGFAGGCWFCAGSTLLFPRRPVLEAVGLQDEGPPRLEDSDWTLRFGLARGELVVQSLVAVAIEVSSRPAAAKIYSSCTMLTAKWRKELETGKLPRSHYQRLLAYLDVERGLAALTSRQPIAGIGFLARSWLRQPRTSWHVSPGWHQEPEADGEAVRAEPAIIRVRDS